MTLVKFIVPLVILFVTDFQTQSSDFYKPRVQQEGDCHYKGKRLYGKIQFVDHFPDLKIQIVTSFPDLKVKMVDTQPTRCGEWRTVNEFPDLKVQIVNSFPDIKVQFVQSFPGWTGKK